MRARILTQAVFWAGAPLLALGLLVPGCGEDAEVGDQSGAAASGGSSSGGSGGTGGAGTAGNTFTGSGCLDGDTQCTDCEDNDGDGLVDASDPECTGPLDNDEATFATGISGDNVDDCQDCFFDGDSGQGNDGCAYPTSCFDGEDPGGDADCFNCDVSEPCISFCADLTPNGCDCFGCCEVQDDEGTMHSVLLEESCSFDSLDDETQCTSCTPSEECFNDCQTCELCIGKDTLPEACDGDDGGGGQVCSEGQEVCNDTTPCPEGMFCLTGCCVDGAVE